MTTMSQDPALQGRASRDPNFEPGSCALCIPSARRVQTLAAKHHLSPALARQVVWLCFGEGWHD